MWTIYFYEWLVCSYRWLSITNVPNWNNSLGALYRTTFIYPYYSYQNHNNARKKTYLQFRDQTDTWKFKTRLEIIYFVHKFLTQKVSIVNFNFVRFIIIINSQQSTAGHKLLQSHTIQSTWLLLNYVGDDFQSYWMQQYFTWSDCLGIWPPKPRYWVTPCQVLIQL